jgi:ABC-type antimicrobial peptide transport system permease subunit
VRSLAWLRLWADLLDSRFTIPGTRIRFGLDPLLSLIPGLGELASPAFAVALLVQGIAQGLPKVILTRIVANAMVDALIGAVPVLGTVADIFWRANRDNLRLLERYATPGTRPTRSDYAFIFLLAALVGLLALVPVALGLWLTSLLWQALR